MPALLRTLADRCHLTLGAAVNSQSFLSETDYRQLHAEHFNLLVPMNEMKCDQVCTQPNRYDFSRADALIDIATQNHQAVRGHTLCWHLSYAPWMQTLTSLELEKVLRDYITTLVERYRGKVYAYDVINEALKDNSRPRKSIWSAIENFIPKCFQWAHAADPEAQLLYLDYRVHTVARWQAVSKMVRELKAAGIPIHGVGMQLHHELFRSMAISSVRLAGTISDLKRLGVSVHLCEVNIGIHQPTQSLPPHVKFNLQAQAYRQVIKAVLDAGAESCNFWGYADRHAAHVPPERDPNDTPCLFDINLQPKPAYHAICSELARHAEHLEKRAS